MSMQLMNWLSCLAVVFAALMVIIRFVCYSRRDQGMHWVYFWGGCLFFALGLLDLTSSVLRATEVHVFQIGIWITLTLFMFYCAFRRRRHEVPAVQASSSQLS